MSETDEDNDPDLDRLKKAVKDLSEHFDSVRIFATIYDNQKPETIAFTWGTGNIFTHEGQVRDWLIEQAEKTKQHIRNPDDDE